jgi:CheY-like chemotaxis protein
MSTTANSDPSVLIVDDKDAMRLILLEMLRAFGFRRIHQAADGRSALLLVREFRPDLVVTDWEMPDMTGLDLVRWIRRDPASPQRDAPVLIVTANDTHAQVLEARDAGVTAYLTKPVSAAMLQKRVAATLDDHRPFVDAKTFVGPCRRGKPMTGYTGPFRRFGDRPSSTVGFAR